MKTLPLIALTASLLASGAAFAAEQTVTLNVANATCELCGPIVKRALSNVSGCSRLMCRRRQMGRSPRCALTTARQMSLR